MAIQMLRICGVAEVVAVVKPVQTQNDTPYRKNRKTPLRFEQVNRSHRMGFLFFRYRLLLRLRQFSCHQHSHYASHHQSSCPTAAVAEAMEVFDGGVEVSVEVDFVAVELELRAIQKRFAACKPRHHFVDVLNEVQDAYHISSMHFYPLNIP